MTFLLLYLSVQAGVVPDPTAWSHLVHAQALGPSTRVEVGGRHYKWWNSDPSRALATIDRLRSIKAPLTTDMFNSVLRAYVSNRNPKTCKAEDFWVDMHLEPDLPLDITSFHLMLTACMHARAPERAFFLLDEMKLAPHHLTPTVRTYNQLIRACAGKRIQESIRYAHL